MESKTKIRSAEEILDDEMSDFYMELLEANPLMKVWLTDAMKEYADQFIVKASEVANIVHHCGHTKQNSEIKHFQLGTDNLKPNREIILKLKEELK